MRRLLFAALCAAAVLLAVLMLTDTPRDLPPRLPDPYDPDNAVRYEP